MKLEVRKLVVRNLEVPPGLPKFTENQRHFSQIYIYFRHMYFFTISGFANYVLSKMTTKFNNTFSLEKDIL